MSFRESLNGGNFYVDTSETVMDPFLPVATVQSQLTMELQRYDDLVQRDYRYARVVAGASKMPMNMVWSSRGEDAVSETDLAAFKDAAWNEFVKKRYLPSLPGTTSVQTAAASMLEIVRDMNLQHRRFTVMGLHEQVEASEIQLVLHLCQAEIIRGDSNNYRAMANRYRRHDQLFEAFGLAVGAFVCSSAPYTMGSGTSRYERDLQFEYKKQTTALFVWALRKVRDFNGLDDDYVARLSRLIVVGPGDRRVGFRGSEEGGGGGDSGGKQVLLDAVVEAQRHAEAALVKSIESKKDVESLQRMVEEATERMRGQMEAEKEALEEKIRNSGNLINQRITHGDERLEDRLTKWKQEAVLDTISRGKEDLSKSSGALMDGIMGEVKHRVDGMLDEFKRNTGASTTAEIERIRAQSLASETRADEKAAALQQNIQERIDGFNAHFAGQSAIIAGQIASLNKDAAAALGTIAKGVQDALDTSDREIKSQLAVEINGAMLRITHHAEAITTQNIVNTRSEIELAARTVLGDVTRDMRGEFDTLKRSIETSIQAQVQAAIPSDMMDFDGANNTTEEMIKKTIEEKIATITKQNTAMQTAIAAQHNLLEDLDKTYNEL